MNSTSTQHATSTSTQIKHHRSRRAELARGIGVEIPIYRRPFVLFAAITAIVAVLFVLGS